MSHFQIQTEMKTLAHQFWETMEVYDMMNGNYISQIDIENEFFFVFVFF